MRTLKPEEELASGVDFRITSFLAGTPALQAAIDATRRLDLELARMDAPRPVVHGSPYRTEIDGLRAVAVLAVVLFHARLGCPGGYVGVDVFFVISGFLITSLILRDLDSSKFRLIDFWERRVRRPR